MSEANFFVVVESDAYNLKIHVDTNAGPYVFGQVSRSEKASEWPNADKEYIVYAECWKPMDTETGAQRATLGHTLVNQWSAGAVIKVKVIVLDLTTVKGTAMATLLDGSTGILSTFISGKGTAVLSNGTTTGERPML